MAHYKPMGEGSRHEARGEDKKRIHALGFGSG